MNDIQSRVERNEIEILHLKVDRLENRLEEVEADKKKISRIKDLASLLTPLIVAAIGFYATYSISGAIQQEKLKLDHLTAMQKLTDNLANPNMDQSAAESAAISLAAFGPNAVVPLIHGLQADESTVRPAAAEKGLRAVGFHYPRTTCSQLTDVLRNESGIFSWEVHLRVIGLLGDIGCVDAIGVLTAYRERLAGPDALAAYKSTVSLDHEPKKKHLKKLLTAIGKSIVKIEKH